MPNVFISSDENRDLFKDAIINYLNGTNDIKTTKTALRDACTYQTVEIDAKTFAKNIPLLTNPTDQELDPKIVEVLRHLKMDTRKATYTDQGINYLYDLLRKQKDKDIEYLMELIDDLQPTVPWVHYIYRPALVTIGVLSFCYVEPQYFWATIDWIMDMLPVVYHWVYHYVVQLHNLPVIGMGMQIIWLLYYLNNTFEHGLDPSEERIRALVFRAIALSLNFMAHMLSYWALGTLSLAPALLFFTSSLVGVIESIHAYWTEKPLETTRYPDVHSKAWEVRYHCKQDRNYRFFLIRLIYAITISALLVAWTVLPPSVIFTMTYMLTMWFVTLIKDYCINAIKHLFANKEQIAVLGVYTANAHTAAQQMEKDKETFRTDALKIIQSFANDVNKQSILQTEMLALMQTTPFVLSTALAMFKHNADWCRKYDVSPSPQAGNRPNTIVSPLSMYTPQRKDNKEIGSVRKLNFSLSGYGNT